MSSDRRSRLQLCVMASRKLFQTNIQLVKTCTGKKIYLQQIDAQTYLILT